MMTFKQSSLIQFFFYRKKPTISACIAVVMTIVGMLLFFADRLETGSLLGNILAIMSGLERSPVRWKAGWQARLLRSSMMKRTDPKEGRTDGRFTEPG